MSDDIRESSKEIKAHQHQMDAARDFERALFDAFFRSLTPVMNKTPSTLYSLQEIRKRLNLKDESYQGLQTVTISDIRGSEGRYSEFNELFAPRTGKSKDKWIRINQAMRKGAPLPPVQLYNVDGTYFVRDGHHRISVASALGQKFIEAEVTEIPSPVKLPKGLSLKQFLIKAEYTDFLEITGLRDHLSKKEEIELTALGGYDLILFHIRAHKLFLKNKGKDLNYPSAALAWYKNLYTPVIHIIEDKNILKYVKKRTQADLYIWILNHRQWFMEGRENDLDAQETAEEFIREFEPAGEKEIKDLAKKIKQKS